MYIKIIDCLIQCIIWVYNILLLPQKVAFDYNLTIPSIYASCRIRNLYMSFEFYVCIMKRNKNKEQQTIIYMRFMIRDSIAKLVMKNHNKDNYIN